LAGTGKPLVLAANPVGLVGQVFPGCWLMILLPFVFGGALMAVLDVEGGAWAMAGIAATLMVVGAGALPEKPPPT
jgi:hypothetical protein